MFAQCAFPFLLSNSPAALSESTLFLPNSMACMEFPSVIPRKTNRILVIFLLLLISSLNPSLLAAQGRKSPNSNLRRDEELAGKMRSLIGSRPPRCDQRCRNCGHCEAIQVPIAAAVKLPKQEIKSIAYSRGDDLSNYKPMCWKCKCGDFIFNP